MISKTIKNTSLPLWMLLTTILHLTAAELFVLGVRILLIFNELIKAILFNVLGVLMISIYKKTKKNESLKMMNCTLVRFRGRFVEEIGGV